MRRMNKLRALAGTILVAALTATLAVLIETGKAPGLEKAATAVWGAVTTTLLVPVGAVAVLIVGMSGLALVLRLLIRRRWREVTGTLQAARAVLPPPPRRDFNPSQYPAGHPYTAVGQCSACGGAVGTDEGHQRSADGRVYHDDHGWYEILQRPQTKRGRNRLWPLRRSA